MKMTAALDQTTQGQTKECPLCFQSSSNFLSLTNCSHLACKECLQTYVRIEIQEGRVNLMCPECPESMHPDDILLLIGPQNGSLKTLYESLMVRQALISDSETRWCPGPDCTYGVIATISCADCPEIKCGNPRCGLSFCYTCKDEWSTGHSCDAAEKEFKHSTADIKLCPECKALIFRTAGCNSMKCPVCQTKFCWLCLKTDPDLEKNHFISASGCTFFGKKPWSRKNRKLCQAGILFGAPVVVPLVVGIIVPVFSIAMTIDIGMKLKKKLKTKIQNKHKRRSVIVAGVTAATVISPICATVGAAVLITNCYIETASNFCSD